MREVPGMSGAGNPSLPPDLERYTRLLAERTKVMRSTAMRDLMSITERPEVISLAGGLPDTGSFPAPLFGRIFERIAREAVARALQYGPTEGLAETKRCVATVMAAEGMQVDPDDVLVTTGGQQVLDLVARTLIDPGDVILAEGPTYPGAIPAFCSYQAEIVQVGIDEGGLRIGELARVLERLASDGRRVKFLYTIPNFQNPAGVTLAACRRRELLDLVRRYDLLVLEDNPYGLLRYEGEPQPTLFALDGGERVMYLGTFSKIFSPGIRVGWVVAPRPLREKMNIGKQAADLCTATLSQLLVHALFERDEWRSYLELVKEIYRRRRNVLLDALAEYLPAEAEWVRPEGGLFVWVTLPDYINTTDLLARALRENVAFVPGEQAFVDGRGKSSLRLNFSGSDEERLREGVRRIGEVIEEQIALYGTLTGRDRASKRGADASNAADVKRHSERQNNAASSGRVVPMRRRAPRPR